jgi:ferredoxin, 2Fe-2S
MSTARNSAVAGIEAECGGFMSCATCHAYVDEAWIDKIGKATERDDPTEAEMLESAACPPTAFSRLSCQITLTDS